MSSQRVNRPTATNILQYRYQHGVNLAGIFVLEQWLHPNMFDPGVSGGSELDAVVSSLTVRGLDATRQKWEDHWAAAVTAQDLEWLVSSAGCNCLRVPVGYFTLGPAFCENTPFAMEPAQVYVNAWEAVKRICHRCYDAGVGVVVDFQAAPGGANPEIHSGTSTGHAGLWNDQQNLDLASRCLCFMAEEIARCPEFDSVIGLQICNEAAANACGVCDWYSAVIDAITVIDPSLHVYVSDMWDLKNMLVYARGRNVLGDPPSCPVVVDTHRYYNYHHEDRKQLGPEKIIDEVGQNLKEVVQDTLGLVCDKKGAAAVFVGEYSCALPAQPLEAISAQDLSVLTGKFGRAQAKCWQQKASGSAFFTWKLETLGQSAWDFHSQVKAGAVNAPTYMYLTASAVRAKLKESDCRRARLMVAAMDKHCTYFEKVGGRYEHWRFADGWHLGWTDARDFFAARLDGVIHSSSMIHGDGKNEGTDKKELEVLGADKIGHGMLDLWITKRLTQEIAIQRDKCEFIWEWEQGFRAGLNAFYEVVGI